MNLDALVALRATFKSRGWQQKATGRVVLELAFHVVTAIVGIALFVAAESYALKILGLIVSTFGSVGVATNTHTATHYGASDKRWVNDLLSLFGYPLFLHLPLSYWRNAHLVVHHTSPNVIGIDDDTDFRPYFSINEREVAGASALRRFYLRHQWVFLIAIVWVHPFTRSVAGWRFLISALRDPQRRRMAHWLDLLALVLHAIVWIVVPSFFFPFSHVLAFVAIRYALIGYPVFAILAPGHYPAEAGLVAKGEWPKDFVALQTLTTVNFRTGPIGRLYCSGLDYQIEHHLFPACSHVFYRRMSREVQEFCEREGYPYRTLGWWESLHKTVEMFRTPKPVADDLEGLRLAVMGPIATPEGAVGATG